MPADLKHFRRHSQTKDGLRNPCKECMGYEFSIKKTKGKLTERKGYKLCKGCLVEMPSNETNFQPNNKTGDGLTGKCRKCIKDDEKHHKSRDKDYIKAYNQQYYSENKSFVNELNRRYYNKNKDKFAEYSKKYREENLENIKLYKKEYYRENKEYIDEKNKNYRINNPEKLKVYYARYRNENKNKVREWNKRYRMRNPKKVIQSREKYRMNNLEKVREKARLFQQKRNALKRKLPSSLTAEQWEGIKEKFEHKCAYCGEAVDGLTQDHFIPLIKGGEYTHNNIVPACLSCNSSKRDYDFFEWYPRQDYYSKRRENKVLSYLNYNKYKNQQLSIF